VHCLVANKCCPKRFQAICCWEASIDEVSSDENIATRLNCGFVRNCCQFSIGRSVHSSLRMPAAWMPLLENKRRRPTPVHHRIRWCRGLYLPYPERALLWSILLCGQAITIRSCAAAAATRSPTGLEIRQFRRCCTLVTAAFMTPTLTPTPTTSNHGER
jgi:hypothetical protein